MAIMPCGDKDDCNENKHTEQTSQQSKHKDESCPPLCHCACCGTTFIINVCEQLAINKVEIVTAHLMFYVEIPTSISSSVWQPPKIA